MQLFIDKYEALWQKNQPSSGSQTRGPQTCELFEKYCIYPGYNFVKGIKGDHENFLYNVRMPRGCSTVKDYE